MKLTIETEPKPDDALLLRQAIASGKSDDGTEIEVAISEASLVLQHQQPGGPRTVHTISITTIVTEWAKLIDEQKKGE